MRVNSNRKIHKMKRDPYKTLLRLAAILAIVVAAGIGVYYLCTLLVYGDYDQKKAALEKRNLEEEQAFHIRMNELLSQNTATNQTASVKENGELQYWEAEIDGSTWRVEDAGYSKPDNTTTLAAERSSLLTGGLLLVNAWHSLPADYSDAEMLSVGTASGYTIQVQDNSVRLFPVAFDALSAMLEDAKADGLEHYIVRESYRTMDNQTEIFNKEMEALSGKYSGDILIAETKKKVNYPGTSEYQTGLSFRMDLYSRENADITNQKFQQSDQGKWFTENAWKYGVIFRFPTKDFPTPEWEDKSYKTGVTVSMNLYRYVGKAHATAMRVMDYCLEEYVEFLINHPHAYVYQDGTLKYELYRVEAEDSATYDLLYPNMASDYQASLDNLGGVVLAYTYN